MNMIEIIVTVCALAQPSQCEEQHLQYAFGRARRAVRDERAALLGAMDQRASEMDASCAGVATVPHAQEKADARGPARQA